MPDANGGVEIMREFAGGFVGQEVLKKTRLQQQPQEDNGGNSRKYDSTGYFPEFSQYIEINGKNNYYAPLYKFNTIQL